MLTIEHIVPQPDKVTDQETLASLEHAALVAQQTSIFSAHINVGLLNMVSAHPCLHA